MEEGREQKGLFKGREEGEGREQRGLIKGREEGRGKRKAKIEYCICLLFFCGDFIL